MGGEDEGSDRRGRKPEPLRELLLLLLPCIATLSPDPRNAPRHLTQPPSLPLEALEVEGSHDFHRRKHGHLKSASVSAFKQDWLHNFWDPRQNENVEPPV